MRGSAPAITEICRCRLTVMTCMTYSLIILTQSISTWSICTFVLLFVRQRGRQMQRVECKIVCLYWPVVQLIFTELCCVKQLISVIDRKANTSLSCCQISCFGLELFLLIFLDVTCVFLFFPTPTYFPRSDEPFIDSNLQKHHLSCAAKV